MEGVRHQSIVRRLWGRLRYGLLVQELLDRLARAGIVFYPYFIAIEPIGDAPRIAEDDAFTIRRLTSDDVGQILRVNRKDASESALRARLSHCIGVGAFDDDSLVGYTWAAFDAVPVIFTRGFPLFALRPTEAYLFDLFVAPPYRGRRLAGAMRQVLHREMLGHDRQQLYSVSLAFNRSTRRQKSRIGALEVELRLYIHIRMASLPGLDLRVWRRAPNAPTPGLVRVPSRRSPETADRGVT